MTKRIIIGLTGPIGCGKSAAAAYICKTFNCIEYMLAKPLKDIAVIFGFDEHQVFGTQDQKLEVNEFWGISSREFLQVFGSEVCREYMPKVLPKMKLNNSAVWVHLFERFATKNLDNHIVVSDVRFADECQKIKDMGGIIIRINRPSNTAASSTHQSEMQSSKIVADIEINNTGELVDLYAQLDDIIADALKL